MSYTERVIILVDMDCFYCQVEENLNPKIAGKPIAVVQYNAWRGGGIIAVNYPARDRGVTRHMRGDEAKKKCPEIELVKVPNVRGKADLSKYRDAGKRVADVLQTFTPLLERASVDEAYLDITASVCSRMEYFTSLKPDQLRNTHVVGSKNVEEFLEGFKDYVDDSNLRLAIGGTIAEEIRATVYARTGYKCSAGIAHNKILAKLVCGLHKPNQQTILPQDGVAELYKNLPVRKIQSLGGKFGNYLTEKLKITNMGDLYNFNEKELAKHFDPKTTIWLYNIARGIDREPVTVRLVSKSIGCCKKFPGRSALTSERDIKHWLSELSEEISERLNKDIEENTRKAKQMVISFVQDVHRKEVSSSRTHPMNSYEAERIMSEAYEIIKKHCMKDDGSFSVKFLGISAGKFEDVKNVNDISVFFKNINSRNSVGGKVETITKGSSKTSEKEKSSITTFFKPVDSQGNEGINKNSDVNVVEKSDSNSCFEKESQSNLPFGKSLNNTLNNEIDEEFEREFKSNSSLEQCFNEILKNEDDQCIGKDFKEESLAKSFFVKYLDKISNDNQQTESDLFNQDEKESSSVLDKFTSTFNINNFSQFEVKNNEDCASAKFGSQDKNSLNENVFKDKDDEDSDSEDSISQEFQPETKDSYFQKYFQQLNEKRVFNTSIILKDNRVLETSEPSTSEPTELCTECKEEIPISEILTHMDKHISAETLEILNPKDLDNYEQNQENEPVVENTVTREFHFGDEDGKEICMECGKRILVCDMISHMDYHFALKIVKEEADIYKPAVKQAKGESKENKKRVTKAAKRKVNEKANKKLTSFLEVKPEVDNMPMETCSECKRKVRLDEFVDHMDFHVAKKLHLEINAVEKSCDNRGGKSINSKSNGKVGKSNDKVGNSNFKVGKSNGKIAKGAITSNSLKSVSSFFKPL